jgi:hypothetical protein
MNMKKRLAIGAAIVTAALLLPATKAAADRWHHGHYHRSGVNVSIGAGAYPAYGSYYYDPYYYPAPDYGYYSYPAYGEVRYYRYRLFRH